MKFRKYQKVSPKRKWRILVNKRIVTWLFIGVIILSQVLFIIQTATMGATLADLEYKHENLIKGKTQLMQELVHSTSLTDLEKDAGKLGFVEPGKRIFLTTEEVVAHVN